MNNSIPFEMITRFNIYRITSELLKNEEDKFAILREISIRILNSEAVTGYEIGIMNGKGNPECSILGEIIGATYGKLKPKDIIYEKGSIFIVLENITSLGLHKYGVDEEVLLDIVNIIKYNKEKSLILKMPITERIKEFMDRYKNELLKTIEETRI